MTVIRNIVLTAVLTALMSGPAIAKNPCRSGKIEVHFLLPSGQLKTICIAESALSGIENASRQGRAKFAMASCPCFTQADVQRMFDDAFEFDLCTDTLMRNDFTLRECSDENARFLVTDGPVAGVRLVGLPVIDSPSCVAKVGDELEMSSNLDEPEWEACFEELEPFLAE